MKPLDPRLLKYANAARTVFALGGLLGIFRTAAIIAWSWCLAQAIAVVAVPTIEGLWGTAGAEGRVAEGVLAPEQLPWLLAAAAAAVLVRAATGWAIDLLAARGSITVKAQLRTAALNKLDNLGPDATARIPDAKLATVLGRGLDALDGYFSGYVPQLILSVVATPILVTVVLFTDLMSGVTVLIVFPVIPMFMVLIGLATQSVQNRQWAQLQRLSTSFLDIVEGLSTLKIFRREARQAERIDRETNDYRSRTMKVLRVTFLSGFVLDLAGTFSIALVAVTVGTRLVVGEFPLALGLFVLLLLPEVFVPVRQVGAAFHASTEGLAASNELFDLIEHPVASAEADLRTFGASNPVNQETDSRALSFEEVVIERNGLRVVGPVTFAAERGEVVALSGQSGAGKSTMVSAALGFVVPVSGVVRVTGEVAWAGQRPGLLQGTVLDNLSLGADRKDRVLGRSVLDELGLHELSLDHKLQALGEGLSGGQSQRVAIARALYRAEIVGATVLLLDEPTSALDSASEQLVIRALRTRATEGAAVLIVSHRAAVQSAADRVEVVPSLIETRVTT